MTKRVMEQKANRTITSDMPSEMSERHLEVLRSYGFKFGAKTGSRFIAAVHEIVGIVSKEQIDDLHQKILALQFDVNDVNGRLVQANEDIAALKNKNDFLETENKTKTDYYKTLEAKITELKLSADLLTAGTGRMAALVTKARNHAEANPNDSQGKAIHYMCEAMVCAFNGEEMPTMKVTLNERGLDQIAKTGALAADGSGIESTEIKPTAPAMSTEEKVTEAENRG